jgi:hypothetical protein
MFNFAMNSNKTMEKKLVTPILMDCDYEENARGRKVIGIHIYSNENIRLWKRWGDGYQRAMNMNGNQSRIIMKTIPFLNSMAII